MEELIVFLIQFLVELGVNILISMPFELAAMRQGKSYDGPILWGVLWLVTGVVLGTISTVFIPALIASGPLRVFNTLAAPPTAGFLAMAIARRRAATNPRIIPRDHFWSAFFLTVGYVIIRLAYAGHG